MFKKARPVAGEDVEKQQLRTPSENKEGSAVSLNKCERRLFFFCGNGLMGTHLFSGF